MVLSRDLLDTHGMLLLAKDYVVNDKHIIQLRNYERTEGQAITIYVDTGR